MGLPLARLPGQTGREYLEDSEPGIARLEVVASRIPAIRPGAFSRLTPRHPFLIGRFSSNDLPLLEEGEEARLVSRRHAEIRWGGTGYIIRDLGAANPAWVNQFRLEAPRLLEDGDSIQIGSTLLRYRAPRLPLPPGLANLTESNRQNTFILKVPANQTLLEGPQLLALPVDRQILIGRAEGNEVRLVDRSVSRRHARLFLKPAAFYSRIWVRPTGPGSMGRKLPKWPFCSRATAYNLEILNLSCKRLNLIRKLLPAVYRSPC
jgi:pSer/pThr/pTyr-binding forkhead associated (FHA) protein